MLENNCGNTECVGNIDGNHHTESKRQHEQPKNPDDGVKINLSSSLRITNTVTGEVLLNIRCS
jgi:hypothetical protein